MNKARRAKIRQHLSEIEFAQSEIESIKSDEEMAWENLPESIQYSERGDTMQEYIDKLDEVYQNLQDAIDTLYDIIEG